MDHDDAWHGNPALRDDVPALIEAECPSCGRLGPCSVWLVTNINTGATVEQIGACVECSVALARAYRARS